MKNKSRRDFLVNTGYGLGGLAVTGLMPGGGSDRQRIGR